MRDIIGAFFMGFGLFLLNGMRMNPIQILGILFMIAAVTFWIDAKIDRVLLTKRAADLCQECGTPRIAGEDRCRVCGTSR